VQRQLLEFHWAGVDKDDATRAKLRQLRDHLTELQSKFDRNISDDQDVHMYATFGHLAGYSSAYYTYTWDEVIARDFFQQFDRNNLLAGDAPMRYRRTVLEPGGSMSANDLVKNFLGRPQNMTAFERWMGEEFRSRPQSETPRGR